MLPRRRYRLLLVVAAIAVVLFYRAAYNHEWDSRDPGYASSRLEKSPLAEDADQYAGPPVDAPQPDSHEAHELVGSPPPPPSQDGHPEHEGAASHQGPAVKEPQGGTADEQQPAPDSPLPELVNVDAVTAAPEEDLAYTTPAADVPSTSTTSQAHWRSFPENFPISEQDYLLLPTGTPKPIPKIQFDFPPEDPAARATREARLAEIKGEMARSWKGYRNFAWMHDELKPVSHSFKDPFCGWAATLVDGMDTLWIMGLRDEFDEAARAVQDIDFTYSPTRNDIPVFETTIRYLGGLLAAYDVSGGAAGGYTMLLEKSEELAEILMGAFDTPNRMPVLYYQWRPEFVSQPRRAAVVNVAELGTLLMEFTRLSQLTGRVKYYDAVARITDALAALQERGTSLDGIFPENLDVSGCNRTATNLKKQAELEALAKENEALNPSVEVGMADTGGETAGVDQSGQGSKGVSQEGGDSRIVKRGFHQQNAQSLPAALNPWSTAAILDLDCVKQPPIVPSGNGYESYSMGGSQDSTYEYFPKVRRLLQALLFDTHEPPY